MLDLLVIIFIIWYFYKKYNVNSPTKLTTILKNNEFNNISTVKQNVSSYWLTANLHGENYLFEVMKTGYNVTNSGLNTLIEYATKTHYHNIILIPGLSTISSTSKSLIKEYNIEIWDNSKLNQLSSKSNNSVSTVIKTSPINDTCKINEPDDPIQDGSKVNSILGNLFNHKIEKL